MSSRSNEAAGLRLVRFYQKLGTVSRQLGIERVYFEELRFVMPKRVSGSIAVAEMQGVLKMFCETKHIPYTGYSPSEIKKHATGKGNAKKADMVLAARQKFGLVHGDNEADALWILDLAKLDRSD